MPFPDQFLPDLALQGCQPESIMTVMANDELYGMVAEVADPVEEKDEFIRWQFHPSKIHLSPGTSSIYYRIATGGFHKKVPVPNPPVGYRGVKALVMR